jgi:hypothetical protein
VYQLEGYANYMHEQIYAALAKRDYLWGSFVWSMFDFGSGTRHEGDVGGTNTKGLVSFDRAKRGFVIARPTFKPERICRTWNNRPPSIFRSRRMPSCSCFPTEPVRKAVLTPIPKLPRGATVSGAITWT